MFFHKEGPEPCSLSIRGDFAFTGIMEKKKRDAVWLHSFVVIFEEGPA